MSIIKNQISNPVKITLYIPEATSISAKEYASREGTSVSRVVTDLLNTTIGVIRYNVELEPYLNDKLLKASHALDISPEEYIVCCLNERLGS